MECTVYYAFVIDDDRLEIVLVTDVIAALLAEAGYDSFVPDATGVCAYIPENKYSEPALQQIIDNLPIDAKVDWTCKHFAEWHF